MSPISRERFGLSRILLIRGRISSSWWIWVSRSPVSIWWANSCQVHSETTRNNSEQLF